MLFLFPVKDDKFNTGVNAQRLAVVLRLVFNN